MNDFNETSFINEIKFWRNRLMHSLADIISKTEQKEVQKNVGVWQHGSKINYPQRAEIKITNSESITFPTKVGEYEVMFSIWVMTGEIRIGVKVPMALAKTEAIQNRIACSYDGIRCDRINKSETEGSIFFDWIWSDESFATFEFMASALNDKQKTAVIVDRLHQIITHIYLATLASILETNKLAASHGIISNVKYESWVISIVGDLSTLEWFITEKIKGKIVNVNYAGIASYITALLPDGVSLAALNVGSVLQDQDSGQCKIRELVKQDAFSGAA